MCRSRGVDTKWEQCNDFVCVFMKMYSLETVQQFENCFGVNVAFDRDVNLLFKSRQVGSD